MDDGYDRQTKRQTLDEKGFDAQIAHKGNHAHIQATRRWPVERKHSWMNGYGKLRRMTERTTTSSAYKSNWTTRSSTCVHS